MCRLVLIIYASQQLDSAASVGSLQKNSDENMSLLFVPRSIAFHADARILVSLTLQSHTARLAPLRSTSSRMNDTPRLMPFLRCFSIFYEEFQLQYNFETQLNRTQPNRIEPK